MDLKNPTRTEALLANIAGHTDVPVPDMKNATRSERLLKEILDNGGGGGGDVTKEYVDTAIANAVDDIDDDISALSDTVADKVDKVNGKSLSTNDYTDADKALVQDSPITVSATGTDLTLSTSSGNLNALTVYGKSEVVDSAIVSAGEGWSTVDLGTLNWTYASDIGGFYTGDIGIVKTGYTNVTPAPMFTNKYITTAFYNNAYFEDKDKAIAFGYQSGNRLYVKDTDYTDPAQFKNSLNGVLLCYQLADPTQGNAIAVKTDDGSGIDGTMATFTTGTPLRGIPDSDVRDVMAWDGSSGEVTKNCGEVDLGTLTWVKTTDYTNPIFIAAVNGKKVNSLNYVCAKYVTSNIITGPTALNAMVNGEIGAGANNSSVYICDTNPAYTDATAFKSAMSGVKLIYELATPTTEQLTTAENASIAELRTFEPQTHAQNNAGATMTIEAYAGTANGKAVQELENRIKSEIDEVKNEKSHFCYSYKIDMNDSNPATCVKPHFDTRYGCDNFNFTSAHMDYANDKFEYGSWEGFIRRIARPCMLKYDGTVDYYLDPDDYSKKITGEASDVADVNYQGNAMVELEKLYFKRYTHNGIQYCFIADRKLDKSFKAYAHHDKYGKELDYIYRACYDGMYDGTRLRSISGVDYHNLNALTAGYIMSNTTRQEEMNFAKANNVSTEKGEGWNILHKSERDYINDILVLISMSTDTQGTFGRGRDSGYVSTSDTGIISTGTMDTKGLFWGKNDGSAGVKVLGIENHWANLFKSCAGWFNDKGTQKVKYTYGTEDGSTGEGFNTDASGYISITGATPTKGDSSTSGGGYITAWQYGDYGILPYEAISGASNKYLCDYLWFNNTATCFALVGGYSNGGLYCGAFYSALGVGAGDRGWHLGAALSYKGLAA